MDEIVTQKDFWDREADNFDSIYSHEKSRMSNFLDKIFRWDMYARYKYTLKNSQPISGKTFLDVGCGSGRYSLELARRNAKQVVGIDVSGNMIETCKRRSAEEGLSDRTLFVQADLLGYDLEHKVDVCIGIGLFDYVKDPLPVLKKMRESSEHRAIVSFPRAWTWRVPLRKSRLWLKGCPVYFYTKSKVDELLNQAGFKGYELAKIGQLYCVTAFPG
ncbi:methyltransferase domain-containing protein [candidate division WOR-3 bacterium]|nr:methyltransferase domain-containing protein [candidate division WOR-3 bacterium]